VNTTTHAGRLKCIATHTIVSLLPQAASATKMKDLPAFLQQRVTRESVSNGFNTWATNYRKQYIDTGSLKPARDLILGTFVLAYAVAWPQEYKHYLHEQAVKRGEATAH